MAEDNTPTNVVDDGIELFHSISKGETVNKNFHAGTYNAALDRASQFYGGEQLYKIAKDNVNFIQDQANDLVSELSEQVSFEKVENFYEVTDGMVTREITITLPTGVEANFNIVAETSNNDLTVRFQDLDGYDGEEIYSETLWDIENEPDNLKSVTSTIDIIDDENVAEGLLDEIGLKSQAGDFNYKDGYDLYKVNIKPGANVVNIPDTAIFVEFGIEKEMSSDFIQGFIERPKTVNQFTNVTQIKIGGKTYDITDTFTSAQALQEHFKDADVLVYTNDIEDVGSKSYMFLNENSYVLEKIDDAQFNIDVSNKYIKNNPYETISKLARRESFTEPERYQVLLNALLDETDTPTSPVLKGREGLTIPAEEDRMLEIKWADYWNKNGEEWGVQVHGTYTAEVVDGFYQFKADNPDIPNWWFPGDFMDGQQLTQRAFVGWGVTQEDIDNLKEGFEKGIFDKEKDKKLLEVVNDLDGSDKLIKSIDTPTNVVDDFVNYDLVDNGFGELLPVIKNPDNFPLAANTIFGRPLSQDEFMRILIERDRDVPIKIIQDAAEMSGRILPDNKPSTIKKVFGFSEYQFNKYAHYYYDDYLIKTYWVNKQKDIVDIVQKIKSGQINNIDTKKLTQFIYELQAFETSGRFQDVDEKADIVKKVIFGNEPILETGVDFGSDFGKYVEAVGVDKELVTILQDNSKNIKNILKNTINAELKNIYPNEYIVVFRSPNPNSLDDVDNLLNSYSKDLSVSQQMSAYQIPENQSFNLLPTEAGKAGVKAYLVPTSEMIDTEALGIRGGINSNEKEILINPDKAIEIDVSVIEDMKSNKEININKFLTDTPGGSLGAAKLNDSLVFDSWVDNYAKTTTSFVDNLPLVKPVKDMFLNAADNRLKRLAGQVSTPGGLLDVIDIYEIAVLSLVAGAIAYNEIDEIPKIVKNGILRTYNLSQGRPIDAPLRINGLPEIKVSEYDIDFEYAMETLEKGENVLPYDRAWKEIKEYGSEFEGESTASGYAYQTPSAKKTDTMETTQKIQPGVQEEKMFEKAKSKKIKSTGGSGAKIL